MPWISHADYTQLIRNLERAQITFAEIERLRGQLAEAQAENVRLRERYEGKIEAEIARNRDREERLLDRVLVSKDAYPVVSAAERKAAKVPSAAIPLNALEEAELKMYVESAAEHGFGPDVAKRMFERDRRKRLEPQADLSAYNDLPEIKPLEEIDDFSGVTEASG